MKKNKLLTAKHVRMISESGLFEEEYYLENNPDVGLSGMDPIRHFVLYGWREGRNPARGFDVLYYLGQFPDVKASSMNPLIHYILYGERQGRKASRNSDSAPFYLNDSQRDKFLRRKSEVFNWFINSGGRLEVPVCEPIVSIIIILYNRAEFSYACIRSVADFAGVPYELIVVDNNSIDGTGLLLDRISGAEIIRNKENVHFLAGCNQAADYVRGEYILFLNNDAELTEGALPSALKTIREVPSCGAVGGKIISPDGMLQEAGSIIWSDGSCAAYGRGDSPKAPEFNFFREVDYCSGAFLLTGAELFGANGKFDKRFMPAYYEDTDYCLRIQESGFKVIYNPDIAVRHFEFGSSSFKKASALTEKSGRIFFEKHKRGLAGFKPSSAGVLKARFASIPPRGKKILYIDERIPHVDMGSGYPRSNTTLKCLRELNHDVTMYPNLFFDEKTWAEAYRDIDPFIEIIPYSASGGFGKFLEERSDYFDIVWVSRPNNMRAVRSKLLKHRGKFKIVYDAEAIWAERERLAKSFIKAPPDAADRGDALNAELELCRPADLVIAVSGADALKFKRSGFTNVSVLGHGINTKETARNFDKRNGLLFVGNLDMDDSPNADSVIWFVDEILPLVREEIKDVELHIAGSCGSTRIKAINKAGVFVYGLVDDLYEYYAGCRVFIAPTRFAAGIPYKVCESASRGLPVIATELLAGQLNWEHRVHLLAAEAEKHDFAAKVIELYRDEALWMNIRRNALKIVESEASYSSYRETLRGIIESLS